MSEPNTEHRCKGSDPGPAFESIRPACPSCTPKSYMAERLDAWKAADSALKGTEWDDQVAVEPVDVLMLARMLLGEELPQP